MAAKDHPVRKNASARAAASGLSGPWAEGLFLDVPYVLDSLFRWSEYRANRAGHVDVSGAQPVWVTDSGWRSPAFWLFVLVSLFLAFGPTFDSLCGLLRPAGLQSASHALAWLVIVLVAALYLWQLLRVLQRLARRLRTNTDNFNEGAAPRLGRWCDGVRSATKSVLGYLPDLLMPESRRSSWLDLIPDLSSSTRRLNRRGWIRFGVALLVLIVAAAAVMAPLALIGWALLGAKLQPAAVCRDGAQPAVVAQLATFAAWFVLGAWVWWTDRLKSELQRLLAIAGMWLLGLAALWGLFAGANAREMSPGPYPHVYAVVVATLVAFACFAYWFAQRLFGFPRRVWYREYSDDQHRRVRKSWRKLFQERLTIVDLIDDNRSDPQLSTTRVVGAFVNGIGSQPLQFLLLPAFVALTWTPQYLFTATFLAMLFGAVLLAYGSLAERWQQIVTYVERWYLVGAPLPLSILVIVLGVLRLLDVQYVSTVLDAAPLGTLVMIIVMCYAAAWFYEYWVNRWPAERLLDALAAIPDRGRGWIPVDRTVAAIDPEDPQPTPRRLGLHGTGRYCVQGWFERTNPALWEKKRDAAFATFDLLGLFEAIAPPGDATAHRAVSSLRRRLRLYFYTLNALLVLAFVLLWYWHLQLATPDRSTPMVTASPAAQPGRHAPSLAARLMTQADTSRPAIIVAASGGGTRAALYTAHALQGLARLDRAQDVVLISGVSGGGFASALFVERWARLKAPYAQSEPDWQALRLGVTEPFIADVIDGAGEMRIVRATPLGALLAESFMARSFGGQAVTMGSLQGPALVLNTTISGHPADDSRLLDERTALGAKPAECTTLSSLAGSRLIFTNLPPESALGPDGSMQSLEPFPGDASTMPDVRLDYTVVRDPAVPLAAAAALNANFPPVFPNARVDLSGGGGRCAQKSFYVTDGGATENLGLVSALYALQGALAVWPAGEPLPPIHLVAIEASAVSYDYTQDRGLGAATGGSKERINGALTELLLSAIRSRAEQLGGTVQVHYLPLPVAFRSRGGFGTHWMYAEQFRVINPFVNDVPNRFMAPLRERLDGFSYHETINRYDLAALWNGLFRADAGFCDDTAYAADLARLKDKARQVRAWICGRLTPDDAGALEQLRAEGRTTGERARLLQAHKKPDYQVEAWQQLVRELGAARAKQGGHR